MQSFSPYNQIDNQSASKSKLNSLLIILIITFFASGVALIILKQIDTYHRNQLYIAEQAALPNHRQAQVEAGWQVEGKSLKLPNFNNLSLNLPDGWYLSQPKIENAQTENMVFSVLVCNFKDCGNADKDKTPAGFSSFRIVVAPEYSEYRDEDIAQYADSKTNFKLKNGSAVFYEITKPKKNLEDLVLPTYSGLAMSEGKEFSKNYDVILTQGTRSKLENTSALKAVMLSTLKSVEFSQSLSKLETWKTYTNTEYGFTFKYPPLLSQVKNADTSTKDTLDFLGSAETSGGYDSGSISMWVHNKQFDPSNIKGPLGDVIAVKKTTIGNVDWYINDSEDEGCFGPMAYIVLGEKTLQVNFAYCPKRAKTEFGNDSELIKEILSTFKFTK
jgi:hypothetical protein